MMAREKRQRAVENVAIASPDAELFARLSDIGSICSYPCNTVLQTEGAHIDTVFFIGLSIINAAGMLGRTGA